MVSGAAAAGGAAAAAVRRRRAAAGGAAAGGVTHRRDVNVALVAVALGEAAALDHDVVPPCSGPPVTKALEKFSGGG